MPGTDANKNLIYGRGDDIELLMTAFRCVKETRRPYILSLLAETGVGKTRLIQEFYAQVRATYDKDCFWSKQMQTGPDMAINPLEDSRVDETGTPRAGTSDSSNAIHSKDAEMPFIWWGLRNSNEQFRNASQGGDAYQRAQNFLDPQLAAYVVYEETKKALVNIGKKVTGVALKVIPLGEVASLVQELAELFDPTINILELNDSRNDYKNASWYQKRAHSVRAKTSTKSRIDVITDGLVHMMSQKIIKKFGITFYEKQGIPLIIILDDVQFLDENSMSLVRRLLETADSQGLPLLLICTTWTHRWDNAYPRGEIPALKAIYEKYKTNKTLIHKLLPLDEMSIASLINELLPSLNKRQQKILSNRADGNPLIVKELAAYLKRLPAYFEERDFSRPLTLHGEKALTEKTSDIYKLVEERYNELSSESLKSLQWSSLQGIDFNEKFTQIALQPQDREFTAKSLIEANTPAHLVAPMYDDRWRFLERSYWEVIKNNLDDTGEIDLIKSAYYTNLRSLRGRDEWLAMTHSDRRTAIDILLSLDIDTVIAEKMPAQEKAGVLAQKIRMLVEDKLFDSTLNYIAQLVLLQRVDFIEEGWWSIPDVSQETNLAILKALSIVGVGAKHELLDANSGPEKTLSNSFEGVGDRIIRFAFAESVFDINRARDVTTVSFDIESIRAVIAFSTTFGRLGDCGPWLIKQRELYDLLCAPENQPTWPAMQNYLRACVDVFRHHTDVFNGILDLTNSMRDGANFNWNERKEKAVMIWREIQSDMQKAETVLRKITLQFPEKAIISTIYCYSNKAVSLTACKIVDENHDEKNYFWVKSASLMGDLFESIDELATKETVDAQGFVFRDLTFEDASMLLNGIMNLIWEAVMNKREFFKGNFLKAIAFINIFLDQVERTKSGSVEYICDALNLLTAIIERASALSLERTNQPQSDSFVPIQGISFKVIQLVDDTQITDDQIDDMLVRQAEMIKTFRPIFGTTMAFVFQDVFNSTTIYQMRTVRKLPAEHVPALITRAFSYIKEIKDDLWYERGQKPLLFLQVATLLCIALEGNGRTAKLSELCSYYPSINKYPTFKHIATDIQMNGID
ncbi:MAG: hypothetical protein H7252_02385 [Cytophaga sp.]|nr:hypothetical protein [Undibacterium sp.]